MWPYLYFYKWIRCYFLWVAMFLCYCLLAIVNTLKSLLGKINHWHRNMHLFFFKDACSPTTVDILRVKSLKKVHCHSGPASFFLTLLGFGSIPSLSMHCTWNSLINLEEKEQRFGIGIVFPKIFSTFHGRDVSSPFRPSHHFVGVGRRCLVLRNQRFNAGVNKNDRCPQGQSYSVNQQRGCWDGMTWWLTKICRLSQKTRWWFVGVKNNLFNRWDEEFS